MEHIVSIVVAEVIATVLGALLLAVIRRVFAPYLAL
ncbi:MAG: hypothetical protein QOC93_496 [Actinomycetota bacterium]|jgi:hypothetical protein|nr:hypothetical protein [Actinomycetota bacterium]